MTVLRMTDPHAAAPTSEAGVRAPGGPISRLLYRMLAMFHRWAESGWGGAAVGSWGYLQASVMPGPLSGIAIASPRRFRSWYPAAVGHPSQRPSGESE